MGKGDEHMTVNIAIANAQEIYPDTFSDSIKAWWISELDGKISRETLHNNNFVPYDFPQDANSELLVKAPYDNIYELYIVAMSQFHSGELSGYGATAALFGRAYEEFRKNYIRNNLPPTNGVNL